MKTDEEDWKCEGEGGKFGYRKATERRRLLDSGKNGSAWVSRDIYCVHVLAITGPLGLNYL
ncbi:predicted protein [Arabidopsis lyrata subsp. lyrata]|uniref:Predicted protein n=1 Tax=Arabidopsis lyrata subsp. lyrata TaxID=81972 RepID=D7KKQ1_ARALL|nr:predicted protein [Arabidopsis lyrata subsp. lyrata]